VLDAKTDYWMATKHIAEVVGRETRTVRDFYKQGLPFTKTSKGNFVKFSDYSIFMQNRKKNQK
jgi:phage terminase Nu1 subunit (DNA packaging protein)